MEDTEVTSLRQLHSASGSPISVCSKMYKVGKSIKGSCWTLPLAYSYLWTAAIITMPQPFYPALASSRGLAAWKFAFVFSALKGGMFLASLFIKPMIKRLSTTKMYLFGQGGALVYCAALGSLYWASPDIFLWFSLLTMTIGGLSVGIQSFTMYAAATTLFRENSGTLIAAMEFMYGVGLMLGSIVTGALIDPWAFPLPFFVVGVLQTVFFPLFAFQGVTPRGRPSATLPMSDIQHSGADMPFKRLLRDPPFMLNMVSVMLSWTIMGFNEPTLGPYLEQFQLSSTEVGVVFVVLSASYAMGSLISGIFCHFKMESFFNFAALLMTSFSYLMVGPAFFIPLQPMPSTETSQNVNGILMRNSCIRHEHVDDILIGCAYGKRHVIIIRLLFLPSPQACHDSRLPRQPSNLWICFVCGIPLLRVWRVSISAHCGILGSSLRLQESIDVHVCYSLAVGKNSFTLLFLTDPRYSVSMAAINMFNKKEHPHYDH
ncbi:unnamed protein product [Ixodes hexagonus]